MAFTPAHAAAALPVARRLGAARPAVLAALVLATMAPDAPYFVPVPVSRDVTHSLRGVVGIDALLSLVALLAWLVAVRQPVRDLAPAWVRSRLRSSALHLRWSDVPLAYAAVVLGGLTHLVWDAFTHQEGWAVEQWTWLRTVWVHWPVCQWLQLGTSAVGCALVVGYLLARLRENGPGPQPPRVAAWYRWGWGLLALALFAGALLGLRHMPPDPGRAAYLKNLVVPGLALTCAASGVVVLAWWVTRAVRRTGP